MFLDRAKELGDRILPVFDTPSGLPLSMVNLGKRTGVSDVDNRGFVSTAEASTLQLEFKYLALLTDEEAYWEKAEKVGSFPCALMIYGVKDRFRLGYEGNQGRTSQYRSCIHLYEVCPAI